MSDTPRTDAVQAKQVYSGGYAEMADHARQLERELRAVKVERGELAMKLAAAQLYIEEQRDGQCACTVKERFSGHRLDCHKAG